MQQFIDQIIKNLESNGFPAKKVSLPTEKMYEAADSRGLSFNTVLDELKSRYQIDSEIGAEKIVFSRMAMNQEEMMAKAQEMMSKMSPEELQRIQEMVMKMSPEEKEQLMDQAKSMGMA